MPGFTNIRSFDASVAVSIDDVVEEKLDMLDCHASQFYEWLPYNQNRLNQVPNSTEQRRTHLTDGWLCRNRIQAASNRALLAGKYTTATDVKFAESFELSEYGYQPTNDELQKLFPV